MSRFHVDKRNVCFLRTLMRDHRTAQLSAVDAPNGGCKQPMGTVSVTICVLYSLKGRHWALARGSTVGGAEPCTLHRPSEHQLDTLRILADPVDIVSTSACCGVAALSCRLHLLQFLRFFFYSMPVGDQRTAHSLLATASVDPLSLVEHWNDPFLDILSVRMHSLNDSHTLTTRDCCQAEGTHCMSRSTFTALQSLVHAEN